MVVSTLEEKLRKSLFLSFSSEMKRLYHTLRVESPWGLHTKRLRSELDGFKAVRVFHLGDLVVRVVGIGPTTTSQPPVRAQQERKALTFRLDEVELLVQLLRRGKRQEAGAGRFGGSVQ